MVSVFHGNSEATHRSFQAWRKNNTNGFHMTEGTTGQFTIHYTQDKRENAARRGCIHQGTSDIEYLEDKGSCYTTARKVCSNDLAELIAWAAERGFTTTSCKHCDTAQFHFPITNTPPVRLPGEVSSPRGLGDARRAWVFQAVPRHFDLIEALKHIRIFRWSVNQFHDEIRAGHDVFLWLAGRDGGMVARGTILTNPQSMPDAPEELPFIKEADDGEVKLRVAIEVDMVFKVPIKRATLQSHPVLSSVVLLQRARGTNFPLTKNQAESLDELCPHAKSRRVSLSEAFIRFRSNAVEQIWVKPHGS